MKIWFLLPGVFEAMQQAARLGMVSAAQQKEFVEARLSAMSGPGGTGSRLVSVAGDTTRIEIKGVMTKDPDFLAYFFGGGNVTYGEIAAALLEAEANSAKETELFIDTPGGIVDAGLETMALIRSHKKPIKTTITNTGASMGYGFASQTNKITTTDKSTQVGSIGIAAQFFVSDDEITITSDAAPKKRPDPKTPEGQAIIKEYLNPLHALFAGAIAEGRSAATGKKISLEHVNENYGQGAVVLAHKALELGMIDEIKSVASRPHLTVVPDKTANQQTAGNSGTIGVKAMTKDQLKAQHPDVYAAIQSEGTAGERDRVIAHLNMAESSGDMKTAAEAIRKGTGMTAELTSVYTSAAIARMQKNVRTTDTPAGDPGSAAAAAVSAEAEKEKDKFSDNVLTAVCQKMGIKNPKTAPVAATA